MDDVIAEIKQRLDLVSLVSEYVALAGRGNRHVGLCPFHSDSNPSFYVMPDGYYQCFGCHARGDALNFLQEIEGWDFMTSLRFLAERTGVVLPEKRGQRDKKKGPKSTDVLRCLSHAEGLFSRWLDAYSGAKDYALKVRNLTPKTIKAFGIGYAPDSWSLLKEELGRAGFSEEVMREAGLVGVSSSGRTYDFFRARLMFPIRNRRGRTLGFGGRAVFEDVEPKYLNSQESDLFRKNQLLFGIDLAGPVIRQERRVFLQEGYMDTAALFEAGYKCSCGYLGTSFSSFHARQIAGLGPDVYVVPDADAAGIKAALGICKEILLQGLTCFVVLLPEGEDADSLLHGKNGYAHFEKCVKGAQNAFTFVGHQLDSMSVRDRAKWLKDFVNECPTEYLVWLFPRLAAGIGLSELALRQYLNDAPDMFPEEEEILAFVNEFPAYAPVLEGRGIRDWFLSPVAQEGWDKLREGKALELAPLHLQGIEIIDYWTDRIKPLISKGA